MVLYWLSVMWSALLCSLLSCCAMYVFECVKRELYLSLRTAWNSVLWVIVCVFMRMFSSCLINVLFGLTHFSLAWYFVSLVSWIMSHINTVMLWHMLLCLLMSRFPPPSFSHIQHVYVCVCACGEVNIQMAVWMCQYLCANVFFKCELKDFV